MATRMQQRRGTAAQWTAANPTLAAGEIGFETDTSRFKMGNGSSSWTALSYFANAAELTALLDGAPVLLNTLGELADAIGEDPAFFTTVANNLSTHSADTTSVHGIADTSVLITQTQLSQHSTTKTNVHGIADTAQLESKDGAQTKADAALASAAIDATTKAGAAKSEAITAAANTAEDKVSAHNSETENVHGIADTGELVTQTQLSDAVSTATVDQSELAGVGIDWNAGLGQFDIDNTVATKTYVGDEIGTHIADTTSVHGIADTSLLATTANVATAKSEAIATAGTAADTKVSTAVAALTKSSVGLGNVDNTSDANKPVSTNTQTALNLKAPLASPTFTGTVSGVTKAMVGLANVDNTTDAAKPVSTATQTELNLKAPINAPTFTGSVVLPSTTSIGNVDATEIGYLDGVTSAIQTQLTARLPLAGGTMTGTLTLSGAPTSDLHAATKLYVDNVTAGINFHESVHTASIINLAVVYNNGTSGVGATLTADTNRAFSTLDGETVVLGQRVLVKNQTDAKQNGIYTLTTVGSVSTPWVLTRATDADNNPAGEMKTGDFCFSMNGTVNASVGFINNSTANPIVIGTDNITYTEFNAAKTVAAGAGLTEGTPGVLSVATGGITSAMIADGTIVDADVNSSAAIAQSKISGLTSDLAAKAPLASPTFTGTVSGVTKAMVGLANVDNTTDAAKPVSTATQTELNLKAPINAPTFTGTVTVAAAGVAFTDGTQTKEGVQSRTPIIQKTASYTLSALSERDSMIEMGSGSALTLTVPTNATVAWPVGTSIDVLQTGAGQVTIAPASGVTINGTPGLKLRTTWSGVTLFKRATDTWVVYGDLTA